MRPAGALNGLRLVDAGGPTLRPAGVVVSCPDIAAAAERLTKRAGHYPSLRVTAFDEKIAVWSLADDVQLPWLGEGVTYLAHLGKTLFFPVDQRPDLPARYAEAIAARLRLETGLSLPLLLWPSHGRLSVIGLGQNACRFQAVEWQEIAWP
jgi:hypothetical protein